MERLETYLDPADPVRVEGMAKINTQLTSWKTAVAAVEDARQKIALAGTERGAVLDQWDAQLSQVYASLIERVGKRPAERFFPVTRRKVETAETTELIAAK